MGNYKFRLSDMMPNAWFYKLKDMSKSKNHTPCKKKHPSQPQKPRKSFTQIDKFTYTSPMNPKTFDTHFPFDPPRKSHKKRPKRKTIYMPSPRQNLISPVSDTSPVHSSTSHDFLESESENPSSTTDIIFDVQENTQFDIDIELPPILTKPAAHESLQDYPNFKVEENRVVRSKKTTMRKSVSRSGVRIRANGAKLAASKKIDQSRKSSEKSEKKRLFYSDSFAIVKASFDPARDFKDSMMEMIVENNIRSSKELEDLLACYLSLNSNQYHEIIIRAFEEVWFNMPQVCF
ncbi:hypothetical protein CDL12_15919 [Handroanthus impetiginosus]|uniref:Transcription repressor n=1 Tax=Handroanthus impetiginosus TaxID=429701 RepID=A0A2G9H1V9_9LAMI|nr:hypothetical protein CDL12_15919 [Handroanthus impetiginosus]